VKTQQDDAHWPWTFNAEEMSCKFFVVRQQKSSIRQQDLLQTTVGRTPQVIAN
jgi:hypothetical protein